MGQKSDIDLKLLAFGFLQGVLEKTSVRGSDIALQNWLYRPS